MKEESKEINNYLKGMQKAVNNYCNKYQIDGRQNIDKGTNWNMLSEILQDFAERQVKHAIESLTNKAESKSVEGLEEILENHFKHVLFNNENDKAYYKKGLEIGSNITKKYKGKREWISVDTPPNDFRDVEVYIQLIDCIASHRVASYEEDEGWTDDNGEKLFGITDWRELTPPNK